MMIRIEDDPSASSSAGLFIPLVLPPDCFLQGSVVRSVFSSSLTTDVESAGRRD